MNEPVPIESNTDVLYSANPLEVTADDDQVYVLKGPAAAEGHARGVAFAEAAAYELAASVDLAVPRHVACSVAAPKGGAGLVYFGSEKLQWRLKLEAMLETGRVRNPTLLSEMIAFDLWVANSDRNIGNVVAANTDDGGLRLCAIDFEKSEVLRGRHDRFRITAMQSREFWPVEDLGHLCRRETSLPREFVERIEGQADADHRAILSRVIWALDLPDVPWLDAACALLRQRARMIGTMAREVWP